MCQYTQQPTLGAFPTALMLALLFSTFGFHCSLLLCLLLVFFHFKRYLKIACESRIYPITLHRVLKYVIIKLFIFSVKKKVFIQLFRRQSLLSTFFIWLFVVFECSCFIRSSRSSSICSWHDINST